MKMVKRDLIILGLTGVALLAMVLIAAITEAEKQKSEAHYATIMMEYFKEELHREKQEKYELQQELWKLRDSTKE